MKHFFILLLSLIAFSSFGQNDSIILKLSLLKDKNIKDYKYYSPLNINLHSNCKQQIKAQNKNYLFIGDPQLSYSDAFFEVKLLTKLRKDSIVKKSVEIECDPIVLDIKPSLEILSKGQSVNYTCYDLRCFYKFLPDNTYQIRLCYKLSKFNTLPDLYSNWLTVKF